MSHRKWSVFIRKGWRGLIVAIPEIRLAFKIFPKEYVNAAKREAEVLKKLQGLNVPQLYNFVEKPIPIIIREFIPGDPIIEYIMKMPELKIRDVISQLLLLAKNLDERGIIVEELSRARDNIIIYKDKPFIVDVEQVSFSKTRSNVTQVLAWLLWISGIKEIREKLEKIIRLDVLKDLARHYKRTRNFDKIFQELWNYGRIRKNNVQNVK